MVIFPSTNSRCRQLEQFDFPIRQMLDPSSSAPITLSKGLPTTYPAKWVMAPTAFNILQMLLETNLLAEVQPPNFWPSQALMNSRAWSNRTLLFGAHNCYTCGLSAQTLGLSYSRTSIAGNGRVSLPTQDSYPGRAKDPLLAVTALNPW